MKILLGRPAAGWFNQSTAKFLPPAVLAMPITFNRLLPAVVVVLAAGPALAAPSASQIAGQLRVWFEKNDLNNDKSLDKEELAKAFRGPKAKPYDAPRPETKTSTLKTDPKADPKPEDKDAKDATPADPGSTPVESNLTPPDSKKYARYVDYQFLQSVDTNKDGKVDKAEFEKWAKGYSNAAAKYVAQQQKMAQLQQRANQRAAQQEMRALQHQMQQQMRGMQFHNHFHHHYYR